MIEFVHIEFIKVKSNSELEEFLDNYHISLSEKQIASEGLNKYSAIAFIPEDNFIGQAADFIRSVQNGLKSSFIHIELSGDYLWDISKIRAFKILLFNILKKESNKNSYILIGETPISNKSSNKEENNLLMLTTESMSAMIAGCEGVWIKPFDFESNKSNQFSQRISRNIYNLLSEESYLMYVNDPSHGSYYLENYTKQIAENIYNKLE